MDTVFPLELFRAILIKCKFNYGMDCVTECHLAVGHRRPGKGRENLERPSEKVEPLAASYNTPRAKAQRSWPSLLSAQWLIYVTHVRHWFL